eukprot:CAMPEP_0196792482 /NCGR_PEP_ID=MMETSP1104-20130614/31523_1 /TAXON_ID=33652 /ORGANISM="Cafeteria sp., Strain Caron Lab Isolate" /LENGTH=94 /DNA_ID=CAMNT_0042162845 /DNA_START=26 /DNA_END=307 /DNA_ORIENTATION=+
MSAHGQRSRASALAKEGKRLLREGMSRHRPNEDAAVSPFSEWQDHHNRTFMGTVRRKDDLMDKLPRRSSHHGPLVRLSSILEEKDTAPVETGST